MTNKEIKEKRVLAYGNLMLAVIKQLQREIQQQKQESK